MVIDVDALRADLKEERLGAYFGGGFGAALVEMTDIETASPDELVKIAVRAGKDLSEYQATW